jgi:NadR type nicotinamide-nucleotide adenylyltransferase
VEQEITMIKKVVIIGPESTGKSTLTEQLATHFKTQWVPEYAREFLDTYGTNYNYEDLQKIANGQLKNEDTAVRDIQLFTAIPACIFIDTDMYVMKVWSEFVFNRCESYVLNQIVNRKYDLYLLCNTDIEWVKDSLREYPDLVTREKLFHHYKDAMVNQDVPWVEIKGGYEERLALAIETVNKIL